MSSDALITLTSANWAADVQSETLPVLVEFGAAWCGPCRMIAPILAELAQEYSGRLKVGTVDADLEGALSAHFGVMGLPTMLLFKQGQLVERIAGFMPKKELQKRIDPHLA